MPRIGMRRRRTGYATPRRPRAMAFTLGWELEANRRASITPTRSILERDGSVSGDGAEYKIREEYVTSPDIVIETLKELVSDSALRVDRSCGFHVHIGLYGNRNQTQGRVWASWMVTLARSIENSAFESVPESRRNNNYCRRFGENSTAVQSVSYSASKYSNDGRYYWMNVVEMFRPGGIKTVEIRLLGNTRRFSYLLAWISVCNLMARSAWRLTNDPSALVEETLKLKRYFERVRDQIRPNTNAGLSVSTANDLARAAGYNVRADGAPVTAPAVPVTSPAMGASVTQASYREDLRIESDIQRLEERLSRRGVTIPLWSGISRREYLENLNRLDVGAAVRTTPDPIPGFSDPVTPLESTPRASSRASRSNEIEPNNGNRRLSCAV